jgi:hypothetical protein
MGFTLALVRHGLCNVEPHIQEVTMANEQQSGRGGKANDEKASKQQAASGGRSEQQAQQRNAEQSKAGHDAGDEKIRPTGQNVKSEPHWDPADAPAARDAKEP